MAITAVVDSEGNVENSSKTYKSSTNSNKNTNDSLDKSQFLNLLVAEMKYQDPLEPQANSDYVAQLATFSQVESMQNMQLTYQQAHGSSLVGKPVIMKTESSSGETGYVCGRVDYMLTEEGKVYLSINGSMYDIDDLDTVLEEEYYQNTVVNSGSNNT